MLSPLGRFLLECVDEHSILHASVIHKAATKFYSTKDGNILSRIEKVEEYAAKLGLKRYPSWI